MGNLIVQNDKLRLTKSSHDVMIRLHDAPFKTEHEQSQVFNLVDSAWGRTGFEFRFVPFDARAQINEGHSDRLRDSIAISKTQRGEAASQEYYPQHSPHVGAYSYIDLDRVYAELGAYQIMTQADLLPPASYITIDAGRNLLLADIRHEVGHMLGFAHEHQRIDRDVYVEPINMLDSTQQVGVDTMAQSVPFGPYDPDSIMHYPGILKLRRTGMGIGVSGSGQVVFTDQPSQGDLMTARFIYNEARIKEHMEAPGFELLDQQHSQAKRHILLQTPYEVVKREAAIIQRTYDVVNDQNKQLKTLGLIEDQDDNLLQWARDNRTQYCQVQSSRAGSLAGQFAQRPRRREEPAREQSIWDELRENCSIL